MVIGYLYVVGIAVNPPEAQPPLVVDANAVLAGPGSGQLFQPVARGYSQIQYSHGRIQHYQLSLSCTLDVQRKPARPDSQKYSILFIVAIASYHRSFNIAFGANSVKRYDR